MAALLATFTPILQETAPAQILPYGLAAIAALLIVILTVAYRRRRVSLQLPAQSRHDLPAAPALLLRAMLEAAPEGGTPLHSVARALEHIYPGAAVELGTFHGATYQTLIRIHEGATLNSYQVGRLDQTNHPLHYLRKQKIPITARELARRVQLQAWAALDEMPGQHALFIPLSRSDEPLGLLIVKRQESFATDDLTLAQSIQPLITTYVHQWTLEQEVEASATKLFLIGEIARRLISLRPLEARVSSVVPLISQMFDAAEVAVYSWEDQGARFMAGSAQVEDLGSREKSATTGLVADSAREGRRVESMIGTTPPQAEAAELALPLMIEDRLLGVLHIRDPDGRIFEADRQALAEMVGAQLAIAALEARNYSAQQEYTWINTVLLEVARHAAQPGDPNDALRAVLQLATLLAGADWAILYLADEPGRQSLRLGPNAGLEREALARLEGRVYQPREFGIELPTAESRAPIPIHLPEELQIELEVEAPLGLILSDGSNLLGVLLIGGPEPVGPRRALLGGIAHQISLRLENARLVDELAAQRLLERELDMARGIQESFLPDFVPQYPGWDLGATWLVARQVGGDFFDFIPAPGGAGDHKVGVVIADVADKGIPAALFMALCITLLRSVAITLESPASVLARLNELLFLQTRPDMFVSVFYAVLDLNSGELRYSNGGHNPPILLGQGGDWRELREHSMVLGVSEQATFEDCAVQLRAEERLVLYTDGVTEAMSRDGELFGVQRLARHLAQSAPLSSQEAAHSLNQAVSRFCSGADPTDDLTAVIIRRVAG